MAGKRPGEEQAQPKDWISGALFMALIHLSLVDGQQADGVTSSTTAAISSVKNVYRINCGGVGFTDLYDRVWEADTDGDRSRYSGGGWSTTASPSEVALLTSNITDATDPRLYQSGRVFSSVEVQNGTQTGYTFPSKTHRRYLLRLHFVALMLNQSESEIGRSSFTVLVNKYSIFFSYSPLKSAGSFDRPVMREFYLPILGSSSLTITFWPDSKYAYVNAIELINTEPQTRDGPSSANSTSPSVGLYGSLVLSNMTLETVHRINCGGPMVGPNRDPMGRRWLADRYFNPPSVTVLTNHTISNTLEAPAWLPQKVYQSQRVAVLGSETPGLAELVYSFPVDPNAEYFVRFHFSEIQQQVSNATSIKTSVAGTNPGSLDALINFNPVLLNYDISGYANGLFAANTQDFLFDSVYDASLQLTLSPSLHSAQSYAASVAGIEVLRVVHLVWTRDSSFQQPYPSPASSPEKSATPPPPPSTPSAAAILMAFKKALGNPPELDSWTAASSPCQTSAMWDGVGCSEGRVKALILAHLGLTGSLDPALGSLSTLEDLWLYGNHLTGIIPPQLGSLGNLYSLRLHNNSLTGTVPEELGQLGNLHELTLDHNLLTGPVPYSVLDLPSLSNTGDTLSVARYMPGNAGLCAPINSTVVADLPFCEAPAGPPPPLGSSAEQSTAVGAVVGALGGALLLICCILVGYFIGVYWRKKRVALQEGAGKPGLAPLQSSHWNKSEPSGATNVSRQVSALGLSAGRVFTLAQLKRATRDFSERFVLGSGGFGKVYRGALEGGLTVAIKRHIAGSGQGSQQFLMEMEVLSKVRHRHLVSLMGYCLEQNEMILVYEFMPGGTLRDHLVPSSPDMVPLSWPKRLEVAIGAAKGIEYLHLGLSPPIIHRDVKTTNILLDAQLSAKVGDFGLSRSGPIQDETHVSTAVRGSFGYVDPEYYKWLKLTEKSDVYSFGVVVLELVAGRKVIDLSLPYESNQVNLVEWARPYLQAGMIHSVVDRRLAGCYGRSSMESIGNLVLRCLQEPGNLRPAMDVVVRDLEVALQLETYPPMAHGGAPFNPSNPFQPYEDEPSTSGHPSQPYPFPPRATSQPFLPPPYPLPFTAQPHPPRMLDSSVATPAHGGQEEGYSQSGPSFLPSSSRVRRETAPSYAPPHHARTHSTSRAESSFPTSAAGEGYNGEEGYHDAGGGLGSFSSSSGIGTRAAPPSQDSHPEIQHR